MTSFPTAQQYKLICQRPDVLGRGLIEETSRLLPLDSVLKARLLDLLQQESVPKPRLHHGEHHTDHFYVNLSVKEARQVVDLLFEREGQSVTPDGEAGPHTMFIAGLVDVWNRYVESRTRSGSD